MSDQHTRTYGHQPPPPPSGGGPQFHTMPLGQVPAAAPKRPWYKKKRFIIPILFVLFIGWIGSLGDDDETDPTGTAAPAAAVEQEETADEPTAEEIAAQEAGEAEAERIEQEQEAAAAEAERVRQEQEAAAAAEAERVRQEQEAAAAAEAARGTVSQQSAYRSAQSYLDLKGFSRSGLIGQLTSEFGEGFPVEDAEFAVARLEAEGAVDWNAEAAEAAQSYLELKGFSRQGLLEQLTSEFGEGFTPEQAEYGVSTTGL